MCTLMAVYVYFNLFMTYDKFPYKFFESCCESRSPVASRMYFINALPRWSLIY